MALVNSRAHFEHVQVIRCDIKRESERNLEMFKMSQFQEKSLVNPLRLIVQTPPYFFRTEVCIFKI
jgi:hypothetical protein